MNVCGIIAEYNPFHNGYQYHLEKAVSLSEADYTIVIMSGNFMQRGIPAIIDKYARTEAALRCGADLILELPTCYACSSAEFFASGALALLEKLGTVTHLCFGSECGETDMLRKLAQIYLEEPKDFQECLHSKLKAGLSFPNARATALIETYPAFASSSPVLSSPNNILGIEYIKAILKRNSSIIPLTIARNGSGYHEREITDSLSSATAIRQALESNVSFDQLTSQLPEDASLVYSKYFADSQPIFMNDFSSMLHYKLLCEQDKGYTAYMDVSEDLSDRILKNIYRFTTFSSFCDLLKTKEIAHSRISRALLHILLNIKKTDVDNYVRELDYVPYARILGFRKSAVSLLSEINKNSTIPLISKLADADKFLQEPALTMLKNDILNNAIYSSVRAGKSQTAMKNEYSTPIVII